MSDPATHPFQTECCHRGGRVSITVTARAYEVYAHVFGEQRAIVTGDCRGGFGVGELIAFLYAYPFPKSEWRRRVDEVLEGIVVGRR